MFAKSQKLLTTSLLLLFVGISFSCTEPQGGSQGATEEEPVEALPGEVLELPKGEWIPVTSLEEPWQVSFFGLIERRLVLGCESRDQPEGEEKLFSRTGGRVGNLLSFGNSITRFEYDSLGRRTAMNEDRLFFYFEIEDYDAETEVVTIRVIPFLEG